MEVYKSYIVFVVICAIKLVKTEETLNIDEVVNFYTLNSQNVFGRECEQQTKEYLQALVSSEPKMWALKMFDASSKMQSGILSGNLQDLGAFDQCLSIRNVVSNNVTISGKHCYATVSIEQPSNLKSKIGNVAALMDLMPIFKEANCSGYKGTLNKQYKIGFRNEKQTGAVDKLDLEWSRALCVPDACSTDEIHKFIQRYFENSTVPLKLEDLNCQTAESIRPKLRVGDWCFIGFLIIIFVFMILSTIYDIYLQRMGKQVLHPILLAFSVLTNGKRLIAINKSPEQLPCLHGIRWFSMMWVILGHRYEVGTSEPLVNTLDLLEWSHKFLSQLQFGSSLSVDTFFMLSGCLLMYGFLKSMTKKIPFNIPLFYLHRYLRLTPALAVLIGFYLTILQYMGSGPRWPSVIKMHKEGCEEHWWKLLLYIENYEGYEAKTNCVGQAWYLAVDMQLFWVSPLILLPVWYYKRFARAILSALVIIFTLVPTIIAYRYKLKEYGSGAEGVNYDVYYTPTYTRAGTWLVGLCLGYVLFYTRSNRISINKLTSTVLWMLSTIVALYVTFGVYPAMQEDYVYNRWRSSLFIGFHRVAWCIALSWIVFACVHGYGGPVNWILSLPMFQVLGRLTYSMYLTHMALQTMRGGVIRSPRHFSNLDMWYIYWGDLFFSLMVSVVWVLAFESPVGVISNILLGGAKKPRVPTVIPPIQATEQTIVTTDQESAHNNNNSTGHEHLPSRISTAKEDLIIDISITGHENSTLDVKPENLQPTNSQAEPTPYGLQIHHRNNNSENKK